MSWREDLKIDSLIGITFTKIERSPITSEDDVIIFTASDGRMFKMCHFQDCCENVRIEDIAGDLEDLVNSPILMSEMVSNSDGSNKDDDYSFTWTFYKFATVKGYVTIRWYGTSNGYYSEKASFVELDNEAVN